MSAAQLSPAVQAIWQALKADVGVGALAPGGVHVDQAPQQNGVFPVLLIDQVQESERRDQFGGTFSHEVTLVRVRAVDKTPTAETAQALREAAADRLLRPDVLPMPDGWIAMAVGLRGTFETVTESADERYQERIAIYRVLSCPLP